MECCRKSSRQHLGYRAGRAVPQPRWCRMASAAASSSFQSTSGGSRAGRHEGHHSNHDARPGSPNAGFTFSESPRSRLSSPDRQRKDYKNLFDKYDTNRSGSITDQELRKLLEEIGLEGRSSGVDEFVASMPTNGDGLVEFEGFVTAMESSAAGLFGNMQKSIEEKIFGRYESWDGEVQELSPASKSRCCGLAHPQAKRRQAYDVFQLIMLSYTLYSVPLQIAFSEEAKLDSPVFWVDFCIWLAFMVDLPIQANTFYQYSRTGEWITDKSKIRKRYCKSWMIVDVIAVFPVDYILRLSHHMSQDNAEGSVAAGSTRMLRLARLFRYLRLMKLASAGAILEGLFERARASLGFSRQTLEFALKLLNLVIVVYSFNHVAGCMWIFVGRTHSGLVEPPFPDPPEEAWWDSLYGDMVAAGEPVTESRQYIDGMYFVMATLTSIGYGDITPKNVSEKWYCYILMYCTAFVYAYVIGVFADMVASRRLDRNAFDMKMRQVFAFLAHCECPDELKDKARAFYNHKFPRKTVFDEQQIYDELPPKFTKALILHRFESAVHSVPFFRTASDECVADICREFRTMPAQAGDLILQKGEHNHELIILEHGEAVGDDMAYKPGSFFGEMEFLGLTPGSLCQTTITAVTDCDLYTLRFGDIGHVLVQFPEMQVQLTKYAEMRQQALMKLRGAQSEDPQVKNAGTPKQTASQLPQKTYDLASASEEIRRCSRAELQAAVLRGVLSEAISLKALRDL